MHAGLLPCGGSHLKLPIEVLQAAKGHLAELQVFDWLIHRVAPAYTQTSIHHEELVRLLATDSR